MYAASRARAVRAAEPMAKPLPVAAVVLPRAVELVGALAHFRGQTGHLGVAAGIVGDGAVGVGGQGDAQGGEHAHRGHADAEETHQRVLRAAHHVEADEDAHTMVITGIMVEFMPTARPVDDARWPGRSWPARRCPGGVEVSTR